MVSWFRHWHRITCLQSSLTSMALRSFLTLYVYANKYIYKFIHYLVIYDGTSICIWKWNYDENNRVRTRVSELTLMIHTLADWVPFIQSLFVTMLTYITVHIITVLLCDTAFYYRLLGSAAISTHFWRRWSSSALAWRRAVWLRPWRVEPLSLQRRTQPGATTTAENR